MKGRGPRSGGRGQRAASTICLFSLKTGLHPKPTTRRWAWASRFLWAQGATDGCLQPRGTLDTGGRWRPEGAPSGRSARCPALARRGHRAALTTLPGSCSADPGLVRQTLRPRGTLGAGSGGGRVDSRGWHRVRSRLALLRPCLRPARLPQVLPRVWGSPGGAAGTPAQVVQPALRDLSQQTPSLP